MALTQQQIINYMQANGLPLNGSGIASAVQLFNSENPSQRISEADIGGAFGLSPLDTVNWSNANQTGSYQPPATSLLSPAAATASAQAPSAPAQSGPLSFSDAFGKGAELVRTNDPNQMFSIRGKGMYAFGGDGSQFDQMMAGQANSWNYDPASGSFVNMGDPTKKVSASSLGLSGMSPDMIPYALTSLANQSGALNDQWAQSAIAAHPNWTQDQLMGALRNDSGEIIRQSQQSGLDKFMDTAIPAAVLATMTAGATGVIPPLETAAATTAGAAETGGGLLATQAPAPVTSAAMTPVASGGAAGAAGAGGGTYMGISAGSIASAVPGISASQAAAAAAAANAASAGGPSAVTQALISAGVPSGAAQIIGSKAGTSLIGAALGAAVTGGSNGGAQQAGTTTSTQSPWAPMQPYMQDIAQKAQQNYQNASAMSPQQQATLSQAQGYANQQMNDPRLNGLRDGATMVFSGQNSPFSPVANTAGVSQITAQQVDPFGFMSAGAPEISTQQAFGGMGAVNPTAAYQSLLTGNVTNPFLSNIANDNFTMANRNLLENVMPSIGSGASAAGQYGGSRQGIAQGLAISRMNQDVTQANNQMFGSAYQQAQGNMLSAANQLGNFGMDASKTNAANTLNNNQFNSTLGANIATNNANRALTADTTNAGNALNTQQFNANLGLSNNTQRLGQMDSAVNWYNNANNMQNTAIRNSLDLGNYQNNQANQALANYAGTIGQFGGMGSSTSQPYFNNPTSNALGGAIAGSQIFKNIFGGP